jgi:hypothetical protein
MASLLALGFQNQAQLVSRALESLECLCDGAGVSEFDPATTGRGFMCAAGSKPKSTEKISVFL